MKDIIPKEMVNGFLHKGELGNWDSEQTGALTFDCILLCAF